MAAGRKNSKGERKTEKNCIRNEEKCLENVSFWVILKKCLSFSMSLISLPLSNLSCVCSSSPGSERGVGSPGSKHSPDSGYRSPSLFFVSLTMSPISPFHFLTNLVFAATVLGVRGEWGLLALSTAPTVDISPGT